MTYRYYWYLCCIYFLRRAPLSQRQARRDLADSIYEFFQPTRTFFFYLQRPILYFQVRRQVRLLRSGRTEIEL